ncbi:hypothetical protein F5B21DRAFT_522188 [Xylaria acuta]|nr:hypothetical protein F5B21DRAFT_522188 [Xylaria acuta]
MLAESLRVSARVRARLSCPYTRRNWHASTFVAGWVDAFIYSHLFIAFGVALSYWVDYAMTAAIRASSLGTPPPMQWQMPIGLRLVPGAMVGLGVLLVKESPRWLAQMGRQEEAYATLLCAAQQCTGNISLAYFAPQIFVVIGAGNKSIFVTGVYGIVKIIGVVFPVTCLVERVRRKKPFIAGAFAMGNFMLATGIPVAIHPPTNAGRIDAYGAAAIAMVYLEAFSFNWSLGSFVWLHMGEIFPPKIREVGNAVGCSSQWLLNFAFSQITPYAIANIGWRAFLMLAVLNYAIAMHAFLAERETRGKSLEEMETVFAVVGGSRDRAGHSGHYRMTGRVSLATMTGTFMAPERVK